MPLPAGELGTTLEVIARRTFDETLLGAAVSAGAHHVNARATDVSRTPSGWRIATRERELHAPWVLGADGPTSLVRRRVSRPFDRSDLSIATGYYVHGVTSREIAIAFEAGPAGYLWSFPRPDHLAVGACAQADESSAKALLAMASRWIELHVRVPENAPWRLDRYTWPIPSLRTEALAGERPAGSGWMLLGDAAGLVDPITREGIYFALVSGDMAATSLLEPSNASAAYERRLRQKIYPELQRAARFKARFFRPRFMDLVVSALQRSGAIREVMADLIAGEQPYHGLRRRLLRTFEWRLMLDLVARRA